MPCEIRCSRTPRFKCAAKVSTSNVIWSSEVLVIEAFTTVTAYAYTVFDKRCIECWQTTNDKNNICKGKRWGGAICNCADSIAEEVGVYNVV